MLTLHEVTVVDSFGDRWTVEPPDDGWTLFAVTGLDQRSLVLWPTVATPLTGPVLDQVDFGVDEDANLVWAVERRVAGRDLPTPARPTPAEPPAARRTADAAEQPSYAYRPGSEVPPYWHPYLIDDDAGGAPPPGAGPARRPDRPAADLTAAADLPPCCAPAPAATTSRVHRIEPAAIPVDGLQLERRYMLGRRTDGLPVLWQQRRRCRSPPRPRCGCNTTSSKRSR